MTLTFFFFVVFTVQYVLVPFTCDKRFFSGEHEIYNISFLLQATVLCDIVVLYVLQKKYFYREKKYLLVDDTESESDDFQVCWSCLVLLFFQLDDKVWMLLIQKHLLWWTTIVNHLRFWTPWACRANLLTSEGNVILNASTLWTLQ